MKTGGFLLRAGWAALAAATCVVTWTRPTQAIDIPEVGDETLTLDVSNTSNLAWHFDNRDDSLVNDQYGDWLNQLYLRTFYWKLSLSVRLDSAVYFNTLDRQGVQDLIVDELGTANLAAEEEMARGLHTRYTSLIYPAKLSLGFKHKWIEVTAGDFYEQLGQGLVFSVRKVDEVAIDTTVRGGKIKLRHKWDGFRMEGTVFGGQMNPLRIDQPTGRILHGSGSPMFFAFPDVEDFEYWDSSGPNDFFLRRELARPSYLEDNVIGANVTLGPKAVQLGLNGAMLFRQSNSEDLARCLDAALTPEESELCVVDHPTFAEPQAHRAHDQIRNFSGSVRVPPVADVFDAYVEVAGQHQTQGRVYGIDEAGDPQAEDDLWGYAVYGDARFYAGPVTFTLEGKHYRQFFPLAANINLSDQTFGAKEYSEINYSLPPTTEAKYVEKLGFPDVCVSGGRGRVDAKVADKTNLYAWVGRYASWTERNEVNAECEPEDDQGVSNRTDTWDTAAGTEIDSEDGKSQYWAWLGARFVDSPDRVNTLTAVETRVFYREGYIRYDLNQHLSGPFSLSALGHHRARYQPGEYAVPWVEGENYLGLAYSPHFSFNFGYEYKDFEAEDTTHYFNGMIQYRSMSDEAWYDQIFDTVRVFVGQRRPAVRCVAGVCRFYPPFEGAQLDLVSRF